MRQSIALGALCLTAVISTGSQASTLTNLQQFTFSNPTAGLGPVSGLALGIDGNFYGTTTNGGANQIGTVYRLTPAGVMTTLYSFGYEGQFPSFPPVQASDGSLYGTTTSAAGLANGSIYRLAPDGSLTTLHTFSGADGQTPYGQLQFGPDGNLYGATYSGGAGHSGTLFRISPAGDFSSLYNCDATVCQGPTGLTLGTDGNFYGVAGGGVGWIFFRLSTSGVFTTLLTAQGLAPQSQLILGLDGNFYGELPSSSAAGRGAVMRLTPAGGLTLLHAFNGVDGDTPWGKLSQGSDGSLYGTTIWGGTLNIGTVFQLTPQGSLNSLYSFSGGAEGGVPETGVIYGSDGNLYGTTSGSVYAAYFPVGDVYRITPDASTAPQAAPADVAAIGQNQTATVSWSAVSGATGYNVYMGTLAGKESTAPVAVAVTGTSASVSNLSNNNPYYFKVAAVNASGPSPFSTEVSATPVPPPVMGTVAAVAGNQQVTLSWSPSAGPVTGYSVQGGTTPGGEKPLATGITATSYVVKGLRNGVTYYFTVTATNNAGTSAASKEVSSMPVIGTLPTPTITPAGGTFRAPRTVHIGNIQAGSHVFYTLDGSTPTSSSAVYKGAITLNTSCTLKAIAIERQYISSPVASAFFSIVQ